MTDSLMDVDPSTPVSMLRGAFCSNTLITNRQTISEYVNEIASVRLYDDQVKIVVDEFNSAVKHALIKPKTADEVAKEVRNLMDITRFCFECGISFSTADTIGHFDCVRQFNGQYNLHGRRLLKYACVHSENHILTGTESVPVIMFLTNRVRMPHARNVKNIEVVTLKPTGIMDVTRSVLRVYRINEPRHF